MAIDVFQISTANGVPQGSTLGPLLFIIYVNDLTQALNEAGLYLYADETCIF